MTLKQYKCICYVVLNSERKAKVLFTANAFSCALTPNSKIKAGFILKHGEEF